jgi:signal transduction histidine kinase
LEAAGLGIRSDRVPNRDIAVGCRDGIAATYRLWALGALCLFAVCLLSIGFEQARALVFRAPTLRAIIETGITLCAVAAAGLFAHGFGHRRRLRDLLLAGALVAFAAIDLISYVLPVAINLHSPGLVTAGPSLGTLLLGSAVLTAATAGDRPVAGGNKPLAIAAAAGILGAIVAELGGLALRGGLALQGSIGGHAVAGVLGHPFGAVVAITGAAMLAAAAIATPGTHRDKGVARLIAAGLILLGAARLNYLVVPTPGIEWVTAGEALRLAGCALILAAAVREEGTIRQAIAEAAAMQERRRIARDLHDGLAQDLAFIAAHGDRIARQAGEDHPLAVAARRALAVSRGAIADLSATEAPSANIALRQVADELEIRFGIGVVVQAEETDLSGRAREDVVRIAREAIVNAAKGRAQHIVVTLDRTGNQFVLRVLDDGAGIASAGIKSRPGFGMKAMGQRAAALGGRLTARDVAGGGTELKVVFR